MSFKKQLAPAEWKSGQALDNDLKAIGFNLSASHKSVDPNIEDTLIAASIEAVNKNSGRIAGLLVDWIDLHFEKINADRLTQLVLSLDESEYKYVRLFWCANAQRLKDRRFKKLASLRPKKNRWNYLDRNLEKDDSPSTSFLLKRNGEDERFLNTCMRVPNKVFNHRPQQIFSSSLVAKNHLAFRYRILIGPDYRADMWAYLERNPKTSAYNLARECYASYASAHLTRKAFDLLSDNAAA